MLAFTKAAVEQLPINYKSLVKQTVATVFPSGCS